MHEYEWTCAGCGVPSPNKVRSCACPTNVVCWDRKREWKRDKLKDAPETIEVDGVWYDRRDTVDALNTLLAEAKGKIETYRGVIREYRQRDLTANPTPPPGVSLPSHTRGTDHD